MRGTDEFSNSLIKYSLSRDRTRMRLEGLSRYTAVVGCLKLSQLWLVMPRV